MSESNTDRRKFLTSVTVGIGAALRFKKPISAEAAYPDPREPEPNFLGSELHAKLRSSIKDAVPTEGLEAHNIFIHPAKNVDMAVTKPMLNDIPVLGSIYNSKVDKRIEIVLVDDEFLSERSTVPDRFRNTLISRVRRAYFENNSDKLSGFTEIIGSSILVVVATGRTRNPTPEKSLLAPEQVFLLNAEQIARLQDPYSYIPKNEKLRTPPLRHELGHLRLDGSLNTHELDADKAMFNGIAEASRRFNQNKDLSGYIPLLTPDGVIYI